MSIRSHKNMWHCLAIGAARDRLPMILRGVLILAAILILRRRSCCSRPLDQAIAAASWFQKIDNLMNIASRTLMSTQRRGQSPIQFWCLSARSTQRLTTANSELFVPWFRNVWDHARISSCNPSLRYLQARGLTIYRNYAKLFFSSCCILSIAVHVVGSWIHQKLPPLSLYFGLIILQRIGIDVVF